MGGISSKKSYRYEPIEVPDMGSSLANWNILVHNPDVVSHIFTFVAAVNWKTMKTYRVDAIGRLCWVSKGMHNLACQNDFWRKYCVTHFNVDGERETWEGGWKSAYVAQRIHKK